MGKADECLTLLSDLLIEGSQPTLKTGNLDEQITDGFTLLVPIAKWCVMDEAFQLTVAGLPVMGGGIQVA